MDIEFREKPYACMKIRAVDVICQEEISEVIIPDSCPDVQAIVSSTAVACIRERELRSGSYTVSGAFQANVLYTAEDGREPWLLESWMPFRISLGKDEIDSSGYGTAELRIRSVDARIINSRKIMIRVNYAVRLSVYTQESIICRLAEADSRLQLRCETVKGVFPVAYAERISTISENIDLPPMGAEVRRILKGTPEVRLTEETVIDGKAVIKGTIFLHLLFQLENGQLGSYDAQFPLSQYSQLDGDTEGSLLRSCVSLTDFSIEQDDLGWLVNISVLVQTVAWKTLELPMITDGYCIGHALEADYTTHRLLQALDAPVSAKTAECTLSGTMQKTLDCEAWLDFPVCRRDRNSITVSSAAVMRVLYYDADGYLHGETVRCEEACEFALADGATCYADADCAGAPFVMSGAGGSSLCCPITLSGRCFADISVTCMEQAKIGAAYPAADRPSLLVKRCHDRDLWELAKDCDTSVRAICEANDLGDTLLPLPEFLLIPRA